MPPCKGASYSLPRLLALASQYPDSKSRGDMSPPSYIVARKLKPGKDTSMGVHFSVFQKCTGGQGERRRGQYVRKERKTRRQILLESGDWIFTAPPPLIPKPDTEHHRSRVLATAAMGLIRTHVYARRYFTSNGLVPTSRENQGTFSRSPASLPHYLLTRMISCRRGP